jgi:hypothetical protein
MKNKELTLKISYPEKFIQRVYTLINKHFGVLVFLGLSIISIAAFYNYHLNGLGLAYNDARSHLDIGRRVVEGLKPGFAQLGSVWLPLPHVVMLPTIWSDFMWHSGLAGALPSMLSFIGIGILIYLYLDKLNIGLVGKSIGILIWATNTNILYLQSTAMTELLLLFTMMYACYELLLWTRDLNTSHLIKCAVWLMLSTLTRYDGWFLLAWTTGVIGINVLFDGLSVGKSINASLKNFGSTIKQNLTKTEGTLVMFLTLASFGIFLWLLWNLMIFKDPLYFAFGPFSAKAQQDQLESAGDLPTKHNLYLSTLYYLHAMAYNSNAILMFMGTLGSVYVFISKKYNTRVKTAITALTAPLFFNVLALYMGHSVLFIQGFSGTAWFNVRYGVMLVPAIAIFAAFLIDKLKNIRAPLIAVVFMMIFFQFYSKDAVTIDDARVGSSQKNVSEVSGWLARNAADKPGFVLISAASHDAIIFSSGLPMKKFIHEGTGLYWDSAVAIPDRWARWIIMRTYDDNDLTWKNVKDSKGFERYNKVESFPFADIYELKPEYVNNLQYEEIFSKQK